MTVSRIGVAVIGGGPAGIAAAIAAASDGASVVLIEREKRLGGKMLQCIHDAFGYVRYDSALTGPEYIHRELTALEQTKTIVMLQTTVTSIVRLGTTFQLTMTNRHGVAVVEASAVVMATGCRERTLNEAGIYGSRPSGIFTAGTAEYILNIMGQLPAKKCIMLGSNNLALVTAHRLTLCGAKVLSVYEPSPRPKGELDVASRCLFDYEIPFHPEHTVTRTIGTLRLRGVELARVNTAGQSIRGSENVAVCDAFIHSTGFVPINDFAHSLDIRLDDITKGPLCDQNRMTFSDGIFSCGNSLFIIDYADFISECGEIAGRSAARHIPHERKLLEVTHNKSFVTVSPQYIDTDVLHGETIFYFNPSVPFTNATVRLLVNDTEVYTQEFEYLRPGETRRIAADLTNIVSPETKVSLRID